MSDSYERRIGGRVDMAATPVDWRVPPPGEKRRTGWRRKRNQSGLLLDLSVSGLQVRAPAADDLQRGSVVHLALDGVHGWGTIKRITPVPGTKLCAYGIQLSPQAEELVQWVHDRIGAGSGLREADWH